MPKSDATTIFPWRITQGRQVVLPISFLTEESELTSVDHVRIEVRPEGLALTPVRNMRGENVRAALRASAGALRGVNRDELIADIHA